MVPKVSWEQVLAWRMRRHLLDPVGTAPVVEVVRRLCGVQAQVASSAELAIRLRRIRSRPGEVSKALADGRLIKTWAMRATLHLLPADIAPTFLSLMAGDELWADWGKYLGKSETEMNALRRAVLRALEGGPLTRTELADAVAAQRGHGQIGEAIGSKWGGILKTLAWQGLVCCGPSQGSRVTFTTPGAASPHWPGHADADAAVPLAITAYMRTYGPATVTSLSAWLGGSASKRTIRSWFDGIRPQMTEVAVDGETAHVMTDDLDELVATRPTTAVRLLPGFDQFVLGPGTADGHVVPPARRAAVSRQAGWIAPVVLAGGRVSGTWSLDGGQVRVEWFTEAGRPPTRALQAEVARLAFVLDRDLQAAVTRA